MCLAIPGQIVEWIDRDPIFGRAVVEFGGIRRTVHLACVPDCELGDYVLVHAGVAICQIDQTEAEKTLKEIANLEDHLGELS